MQIAERDARHATDLKNQIKELQKAIVHISQQIDMRLVAPADEEQTQLLDDMKNMQTTSLSLQRRASSRLEYLTSQVTGSATLSDDSEKAAITTQPGALNQRELVSVLEDIDLPDFSSLADSPAVTPGTTHNTGPEAPSASTFSVPETNDGLFWGNTMAMLSCSTLPSYGEPLSLTAPEFEEKLSTLLISASEHRMGIKTPFTEDLIIRIADLLAAVGKLTWSQRPRTYLVLRIIDEVSAMDNLVLNGYKDIDLPYNESTIPECIKELGAQHNFLQTQRFVLSEKSADLVRGGRHRHLDKSADKIFVSLGRLGTGGYSIVDTVRLRSRLTLQEYARKRIVRRRAHAKDRKALEFFENEIHNLKRLSHHHLVKFVGSYTDSKYIGIIMQPVADMDLHRHLSKDNWRSDELTLLRSWVGCLCSALAYLHAEKCRHKDLKPHNILIKGSNVLLADFGNAFDWTEFESEVTTGPPDSYTRLYVAPEVGLQKPRDRSSDIWSLGCVFLEIATILAGKSLQSKTEFFSSCNASTTAYWRNHEAIGRWVAVMRAERDVFEAPLFTWIENMTALAPHERSAADELVGDIFSMQEDGHRYRRECCFEDCHSDASSWQSSLPDEVFETAHPLGDMMTMSSADVHIPQSLSMDPIFKTSQGPPGQERLAGQIASPNSHALGPSNDHSQTSLLNLANHEIRDHSLSSTSATPFMDTSVVPGLPSVAKDVADDTRQSYRKQDEPLHQSAKDIPEQSFIPEASMSAEVVTEGGFRATTDVEQAFFADHYGFECLLIKLRREDPDWPSRLSNLTDKSPCDSKGFNILHVACKFSNLALAKDVVEMVVRKKPELTNTTTMFGNSALHYATYEGHAKVVEILITYGARPEIQNFRGLTPLHTALRHPRRNVVEQLLAILSPDQINISDDCGRRPLHVASQLGYLEVVRQLIVAGAEINPADRLGYTPHQLSANAKMTEVSETLTSSLVQSFPKYEMAPIVSLETALQKYDGLDSSSCLCPTCLLVKAVRRARAADSEQQGRCLCRNHLRIYEKDALSHRQIFYVIHRCTCHMCHVILDIEANSLPCGISTSEDLDTQINNQQTSRDTQIPFTNPPTSSDRVDVPDGPLPPYPGHTYYDFLINRCLNNSASESPAQESKKIVLKTLADAGFSGTKSYRKDPDLALKWVIDSHITTPLPTHIIQITEFLLDCGANVDAVSEVNNGWTLLCVAAKHGNLLLILTLLKRNATLRPATSANDPLDSSGAQGDSRALVLVPRGAAGRSQRQVTQTKKESISDDDRWQHPKSALQVAVGYGQTLSARMLLRAGANVNERYRASGNYLLHDALERYPQRGCLIPLLLAHGALDDLQNNDGITPLQCAVSNNQLYAAKALLENGADVNLATKKDDLPIWKALEAGSAMPELISMLLLYGAEASDRPRFLKECIQRGNIESAKILIEEYGFAADFHSTNAKGVGILHQLAASPIKETNVVDFVMGYGVDVNAEDKQGSTPLHYAALTGDVAVLKKLLKCGAEKHWQNQKGELPLDLAREKKHWEAVECLGGKRPQPVIKYTKISKRETVKDWMYDVYLSVRY